MSRSGDASQQAATASSPEGARGVRRDIQGLRAVAVLAVIGDHAGVSFLRGGYVGVDVFFVLSGFLITGLLVREADRDGRIALGSFYARRARRILPAATLVLVAVIAFSVIELSYRAVQRITVDATWAAAFLANVRFSRLGTDYFSEGLPPSPIQHYWSLSVEEQFYLVWPGLLALLLLAHRRRSGGNPWPLVAAVATTLCLASLTWCLVETRTNETAAYFSSLARAWELGAGMLLALGVRRLEALPRGARHLLTLTGMVAIAYAVLRFDADTPFPGWHVLLPVLGTVAIVAAGIGTDGVGVGRLLMLRPATWVGDLSYSLYLWHWPVLVLWAARTGAGRDRVETLWLLAAILALSVASYYLVENPVRRGRWFRASRVRGLVLWPVAISVVVAAAIGGRHLAGDQLEQRFDQNEQYAAMRSSDVPIGEELAESLRLADQGSPVAFPLDSLDEVDRLGDDLWNITYPCVAEHDDTTTAICPVGDPDADRTLVLLGDSHAGQWLPAFDVIGQRLGYRVVPLIKYGCVPYDVDQLTDDASRPYTECADFRAWAREQLPELKPDVVVVGSRSVPRNVVRPSDGNRQRVWAVGVRSLLRTLDETTDDVRVLGDTSPLSFDPMDCLTDAHATMASCTSNLTNHVRDINALTEKAATNGGASYLDVLPLVCRDDRCPAVAGGRMVHANFDHLSVDWALHTAPELRRLVDLPQ